MSITQPMLNQRQLLKSVSALVTASQPTAEQLVEACAALAAVVSDMTGRKCQVAIETIETEAALTPYEFETLARMQP